MITVYYAKISPFLKADDFGFCLNLVEERRREKILKLSGREEQARSLAAGSILHYALCRELKLSPDTTGAFSIGYEEDGKPFLTEYGDMYFNLSHSGEYVCCAAGDEPVGVDIQKHTPVREKLAHRFFTKEDNRKLALCSDKERRNLFFRMWSIKESYVKLLGKGMRKGLDSFEINWEQKAVFEKDKESPAAFFYEKRDIPEYSFSLCLGQEKQEICWAEVDTVFF